jgi:hypothetical protein
VPTVRCFQLVGDMGSAKIVVRDGRYWWQETSFFEREDQRGQHALCDSEIYE